MYLSRLELHPEAARNPAFWADLETLYGSHQALWQLFADSPERKRDFLFRKEGDGAGARWYTLSKREPKDLRGFWKVEPKAFAPRIEPGMRLHFKVRVNPTISRKRDGKANARHDVVMNAKRLVPQRERSGQESSIIKSACTAWLQTRSASHGFEVQPEEMGVEGYRQLGGRKSGEIQLSTVDLEGVLTVRDLERFTQVLFEGLGPAKSFGCGLVLIRRA